MYICTTAQRLIAHHARGQNRSIVLSCEWRFFTACTSLRTIWRAAIHEKPASLYLESSIPSSGPVAITCGRPSHVLKSSRNVATTQFTSLAVALSLAITSPSVTNSQCADGGIHRGAFGQYPDIWSVVRCARDILALELSSNRRPPVYQIQPPFYSIPIL